MTRSVRGETDLGWLSAERNQGGALEAYRLKPRLLPGDLARRAQLLSACLVDRRRRDIRPAEMLAVLEFGQQLPFAVPNLDNALVTAREDPLRIRCHGEAQHGVAGLTELALVGGLRGLPSRVRFQVFVREGGAGIRAGDDGFPITGPANRSDRRGMFAEHAGDMAGFDVPDLELFVRAAAGDLCGIGVEGDGEHLSRVAFEPG